MTKLSPERLVWYDEKFFVLKPKINSQNTRCWVDLEDSRLDAVEKYPEDMRHTMKQSQQQGVMVGMAFSAEHGLGRVHIMPKGLKIDSEAYQQTLLNMVMPEVQGWYRREARIHWMSDGAPSHRSKSTQAFMARTYPTIESCAWPPQSPDLSPLDFGVWGAMVQKMPAECSNLVDLRASLMRARDEVGAMLHLTAEFWSRVRLCGEEQGSWFEHKVKAWKKARAAAMPVVIEEAHPTTDLEDELEDEAEFSMPCEVGATDTEMEDEIE